MKRNYEGCIYEDKVRDPVWNMGGGGGHKFQMALGEPSYACTMYELGIVLFLPIFFFTIRA